MIVKIGDTIMDARGRVGVVHDISISTDIMDFAGEYDTALKAKRYDTELKYSGSVAFGTYWCYLAHIESVIPE